MPSLTLGIVFIALIARMTRASMLEVLSQDYIRTAQSKGLSTPQVLIGHALKNASVPIVTTIGLGIALLISGVVVTETVFAIPGTRPAHRRCDPAARLSGHSGRRAGVLGELRAGQSLPSTSATPSSTRGSATDDRRVLR